MRERKSCRAQDFSRVDSYVSLCLLKNPQMPQISQTFGNVVVAHLPMITFLSPIVSFLSFRIRSRASLELEVKAIVWRHVAAGELTCHMWLVLHRAVRIDGWGCSRCFGATGRSAAPALERRDQGTDRGGILCARRGRIGCGAPPWALAAASVGLALRDASRVAEAAGRRGDAGGLRYEHDAANALFIKRPGLWSARRPRPTA
jgi:hypothetical protein